MTTAENMSASSLHTSTHSTVPCSGVPAQFRTQEHPCEWVKVKEMNAEYCDVHDVSMSRFEFVL